MHWITGNAPTNDLSGTKQASHLLLTAYCSQLVTDHLRLTAHCLPLYGPLLAFSPLTTCCSLQALKKYNASRKMKKARSPSAPSREPSSPNPSPNPDPNPRSRSRARAPTPPRPPRRSWRRTAWPSYSRRAGPSGARSRRWLPTSPSREGKGRAARPSRRRHTLAPPRPSAPLRASPRPQRPARHHTSWGAQQRATAALFVFKVHRLLAPCARVCTCGGDLQLCGRAAVAVARARGSLPSRLVRGTHRAAAASRKRAAMPHTRARS